MIKPVLEIFSGLALCFGAGVLTYAHWLLPPWLTLLLQIACLIVGLMQALCWCFRCLPCAVISTVLTQWAFAALGIVAGLSGDWMVMCGCFSLLWALSNLARDALKTLEERARCGRHP